jgi:hypothetical protein
MTLTQRRRNLPMAIAGLALLLAFGAAAPLVNMDCTNPRCISGSPPQVTNASCPNPDCVRGVPPLQGPPVVAAACTEPDCVNGVPPR